MASAPTASSTRSASPGSAPSACAPNVIARARRASSRSTTATCGSPSSSAACKRDEPDRPGADHDRALGALGRQPHGVDAVRQRLHQRADAHRDGVGQPPRVGRADLHEVRERARHVHADEYAVQAQVRVPGPAQPALAAAGERVHGHARALQVLRALAGRDHGARELVPHHQRRRPVAHVAEVALDLRAADADRLGLQDQLARPGIGRIRLLLHGHLVRALPDDGAHSHDLHGVDQLTQPRDRDPHLVAAAQRELDRRNDRRTRQQHCAHREVLRAEEP